MATRLDDDRRAAVRALLARSSVGPGPATAPAASRQLAARLVRCADQTLPYRQRLDPAALTEPRAALLPGRTVAASASLATAVAGMFAVLEYEMACRIELDEIHASYADEHSDSRTAPGASSTDGPNQPDALEKAAVLEELDGPVADPSVITELDTGVTRGMWDCGLGYLIGLPNLPAMQRRIVALRDICAIDFAEIAEAMGMLEEEVREVYSEAAISLAVRLVRWRRARLRRMVKERNTQQPQRGVPQTRRVS